MDNVMARYEDWLDGINLAIATRTDSASNLSRVIVIHAVRSAVRELLSRSKIWVHRPKSMVRSGDYSYVVIPRDTYIIKARYPKCDCQEWLNNHMSISHPNKIMFSGLSDDQIEGADLSSLEIALSVTQRSLECPMFVFDRYYDGIISGAVSILQLMPGKAWSEPNMAAAHAQIFDEVVKQATIDADNGFGKPKSRLSVQANFI